MNIFFNGQKAKHRTSISLLRATQEGGITAEPLRKAANLLIKWALHQRPFVKYLFRVSFPIKRKKEIFGVFEDFLGGRDRSNAALLDHGT